MWRRVHRKRWTAPTGLVPSGGWHRPLSRPGSVRSRFAAMARRYDTVSFLSDYGTADEFVGVVHSVIRDLAPHVRVIDLTHGVAPFDVRAGSLALARSISYVASGVVLAVVDPGVATLAPCDRGRGGRRRRHARRTRQRTARTRRRTGRWRRASGRVDRQPVAPAVTRCDLRWTRRVRTRCRTTLQRHRPLPNSAT